MSAPRMRLRTRLAAVAGVAAFLVLAGTGAGHAYWTASSAVTATATSTSASLAMGSLAGLTTTYTSTSTGPVIAAAAITNTGGTPLVLTTGVTTGNPSLAGQIALRYWVRSGSSCGTGIPGSGVTVGTLAAPPALPAGAASLAAGAALNLCVATSFTGTYAAYAGQSVAVTLTLTGTIGANWTATATGAFTQGLQAASATTLICENADGGHNVILSWTNPPGVPTSTRYRIYATLQPSGNPYLVAGDASYWYTAQHVSHSSFSVIGTYALELWMYPDSSYTNGTYLATRTVTVDWNQWQSNKLVSCAG